MITRANYYEKIKGVDFSQLDADMNAMKEQVDKITFNGTDWTAYEADKGVKEAFDMYFQALEIDLNELESKKTDKVEDATKAYKAELKKLSLKHLGYDIVEQLDPYDRAMYAKTYSPKELLEYFSSINHVELLVPFQNKKTPTKTKNSDGNATAREKSTKRSKTSEPEVNSKKVELLSPEIKFLKSFVRMDGKNKTRHQIRLFINRLQKAIQERRITKTSKYAKQIMEIQEKLIAFHGRFKNDEQQKPVVFNEKTKAKFLKLLADETQMLSVKHIKSYINLQGKLIPNKKAANLFNRIQKSIGKGLLDKRDKYWKEIDRILNHLETFIEKNPQEGILKVEARTLNGLNGIVSGCGCKRVGQSIQSNLPDYLDIDRITNQYGEGTKSAADNRFMMNSQDLMNVNFTHVGLKDKWLDFIGDPEIGFRIATFGAPKMGKSYLMIEFAGYLAANHGKVLYIAKEEGKSATLKKKLKDTASTHPNMMVSNYIPENLDDFDFVVFDSVTKLGLSPKNLIAIHAAFPQTGMIEIHQVTKDGKARGLNDFVHDVDGIIEVYEKGRATQKGRFNQGGELDFFDENAA